MKRVAVAMSGGVDSSVAVFLLKKQGYDVIGITMRLLEDDGFFYRNIAYAKEVCRYLNVPHFVLDLATQFKNLVIDKMLSEYRRGRTPNPCIICNSEIKFGLLLNKASSFGADFLATGHHARIRFDGGRYRLLKGVDRVKDQSYFLYTLDQERLSHLIFPIGEYRKHEIKEMARRFGLPVVERDESQDLCFASSLKEFFQKNIQQRRGEILDLVGRKLGEHNGIVFFTIGQRRGIGISSPRPLYVVRIDAERNAIFVGPEEALYCRKLIARSPSWVDEPPSSPLRVRARVRYQSPEVEAEIYPDKDRVLVIFSNPQRALTPGQSVVFYKGDEVLGGGIIDEVA